MPVSTIPEARFPIPGLAVSWDPDYSEAFIFLSIMKEAIGEILYSAKIKALKNYLIPVLFDDNEPRIYICYQLLHNSSYSRIKDPELFKKVQIDNMGLVCWNGYTDIEPRSLNENSIPKEKCKYHAKFYIGKHLTAHKKNTNSN